MKFNYRKAYQPLLALSACLFPFFSNASLMQIQHNLAIFPLFQCEFSQTRQLKEMNLNLQSSGEFILSQQKGVIWQQTAPFPQTIVMTEKQIYQSVMGAVQIISAKDQPQLFHFTQLMSDILQGNWQALGDYFVLQSQPAQESEWQVLLTPKKSPFQQIFNQITLTGDKIIKSVLIQDKQGDNTHLQFQHCKALKTLTDEQEKLLAQ
ncbi:outer membrane lipoprotein carrier protein LolA [Pasteurella dagmatis]|uniref:Outer membrane lipoprotein carrier protein LolA n=1 Tax=Pasteurella dagmatis ATCC 43325 TaxID=667128 RepID=C9PNU3_9PAST|nr:outer membrane lipoprotein carrier protein LolA [Pasteurella dagmatis]EEX50734.1 hypothetical protein HMPREF0621_0675 [Pasteurella dagmatis ATCC 43325]SNV78059.1 lipoprotein chaperone [Pasteurella dagmatis]